MSNYTNLIRKRLIDCKTHFQFDQIDAVIQVLEEVGYLDMYEALKYIHLELLESGQSHEWIDCLERIELALNKAEGHNE